MQFPQRRLSPAFRAKVRSAMLDGRPAWMQAQIAGFPQPCTFSTLLNAPRVSMTRLNVERLQRVAVALDFPIDEIFLADESETRS